MPRITVVGDIILDRYLIGDVERLNPEAPGVVIRVDSEEDRLGGAAAVAMIANSLGAEVTLAGVIGRDEPGERLHTLLADGGIQPHLWLDVRPTTWKQRIVARGQLRPDRCDREITRPIGGKGETYLGSVPIGDALVIQDYGKGVCTTRLVSVLIQNARAAGVPIMVDPARSRPWRDYAGATLIKANWSEALEIGRRENLTPTQLASRLAAEHSCTVVITLGERGMVCAEQDGAVHSIPAEQADVRDVCGAGDTVLASLAFFMLGGASLRDACVTATRAAAQQVSTLGVSALARAV